MIREKTSTDVPIKRSVANPVAHQKMRSSLFVYIYSRAFVVNKLVKKTIVIGLESVRRKIDKKLENRFVECTRVSTLNQLIAPLIILIPKIIKTIELQIQKIYFIFLCSNNFPIPKMARVI